METGKPIRVLVIDDSTVMRGLLRMTLAECPDIEIAGMAGDGCAGLAAIERLKPDLVLLDIEMPGMNGLEVLGEIRARSLPVRVMICSTLTRRGAGITLEALARGASDYVAKPFAQRGVRESIETLSRELLPKIRALFPAERSAAEPAASAPLRMVRYAPLHGQSRGSQPHEPAAAGVLVVGVSTGGPAALERFLPALPADYPLPVLIVQHMPALFTALLAERLNGLCALTVREALAGEIAAPGTAYLVRGDRHIRVTCVAGRCSLRLAVGEPDEICRPSVDVLFRSAAAAYGARVLAVVLTGMGADGLEGCRAIHAAGGRILVQDRKTSAVWGMPGVVATAGLADQVLPLEAMALEVVRSTGRHVRSMSA
jgi:two-component system, chemotaxis family, protein-glutamate methylesterase/glutaminase